MSSHPPLWETGIAQEVAAIRLQQGTILQNTAVTEGMNGVIVISQGNWKAESTIILSACPGLRDPHLPGRSHHKGSTNSTNSTASWTPRCFTRITLWKKFPRNIVIWRTGFIDQKPTVSLAVKQVLWESTFELSSNSTSPVLSPHLGSAQDNFCAVLSGHSECTGRSSEGVMDSVQSVVWNRSWNMGQKYKAVIFPESIQGVP